MTRIEQIADFLRFSLISPELLLVVVTSALWIACPSPFEFAGRLLLDSNAALLNVQITWPISGFAAACTLVPKVLFPASSNRVLVSWPDYVKLKNRAIFAVFVAFVGLVGSIALAILAKHIRPSLLALLTAICGGSILLSAATLALAAISVRQIVENLQDPK